jgi:antitoxin HigA-1
MMNGRERAASHGPRSPGSVLRAHLLDINATQTELAHALGVSRVWVNLLLNGRCTVSADMALRLGRVLGTGPEPWIQLQVEFDLLRANERLGKELHKLPVLRSHENARLRATPPPRELVAE